MKSVGQGFQELECEEDRQSDTQRDRQTHTRTDRRDRTHYHYK